MSDYIVSARKYRPDSFASLIGQDNIARTLKNSILRGQLAHAYLFCGPRGVGKTSAARIFAKTINCAHPGPDLEPCGECDSCVSFQEGRSYCIHELDAASNNGVEDIKTLMDQVLIPPQVGKYSVFIIDEVHMLSTAAFNAFLKTLEEPPAHAIFILATTEKHKILPTILSRCQTYDFNRISVPDIVRNLQMVASSENVKVEEEALHVIASKADGAMRDALTIFDQMVAFCGNDIRYADVMHNLNVLDYEYCFRIVDSFLAGDYATPMLVFDEVLSKGFNAAYFVSALSSHLRDLLVCGTGGLESLVDYPDSLRQRYQAQAAKCPVKFLYDALSIAAECEAGYRASLNQRLHIEFCLMRMAFLLKQPSAVASQPAASAPVAAHAPAQPAPAPAPASAEAPVPAPSAGGSSHTEAPAPAAASPAPAHEPASPAPAAPQPRRRPAKTAASLSLSSLTGDGAASDGKAAEAEVSAATPDALPGMEKIREVWAQVAAGYSAQPRLSNALMGAELELAEEDGKAKLLFYVTNEAQKRWIEEKILRELERRVCERLGVGALWIVPTVTAAPPQAEVKYMPAEQAEELMGRNEEVKNLVKDFSLDIN